MTKEMFTSKAHFTPPKAKFPQPAHLCRVCSVSCSGMSAEQFFSMLRFAGVTCLLDTRIGKTYRGTRFAHGDDLPYWCSLHQIDYLCADVFCPTREMREAFATAFKDVKKAADRDSMAWTNYLLTYEALMQERKPFKTDMWRELVQSRHRTIAIMCSCARHDDCHRSYAVGMIQRFITGVTAEELYPDPGNLPKLASPRRYRRQDFEFAELLANVPSHRK